MLRLLLVLLFRVHAEECQNIAPTDGSSSGSGAHIAPRPPRASLPALADIIGLGEAKAVLQEAVVLPASLPGNVARLFWRSSERSAVLLVGPSGLGKSSAVEAAASAAGAQVLSLLATEVAASGFCRVATAAASASGRPVVVLIEGLEAAPEVSHLVGQCLRDAAVNGEEAPSRLFIVATMARSLGPSAASILSPFGYVAELPLPGEAERKQFLLRLFAQISRVDAQWGSALREAAVTTLASLTVNYAFAEIDLVVRRAFLRSTTDEGVRDPVALHHFEKILADMPPQAAEAFNETFQAPSLPVVGAVVDSKKTAGGEATKTKSKDIKDPMDGIFGWCNFWLPEALHLPPVVWAMIIFGVLAHFMARSTYQPYGHRKRRGAGNSGLFGGDSGLTARAGGAGAEPGSLFGDIGAGSNPYPPFGEQMNEWAPYGSPFANFPPPPGMGRGDAAASGAAPGGGASGPGATTGAGDGATPITGSSKPATSSSTHPESTPQARPMVLSPPTPSTSSH